jgi:dynein heavy chain
MRNNVQQLTKLTANLEAARDELEQINNEEALLQWEPTAFPQLQHMFQAKDPYDKLWNTLLNFTEKQDKWMKGWYLQIQKVFINYLDLWNDAIFTTVKLRIFNMFIH